MAKKEITPESVWNEYETACNFKAGLNLYDNVRANENFYIGKQWEGVQSNGLPTPVFKLHQADHPLCGGLYSHG